MFIFMVAGQSLIARLIRFREAGLWLGGCDEIIVSNQKDMFENRKTIVHDEFRGLMVAPFYSGSGKLPSLLYLLNQSKPHVGEEPRIHTLYGGTGDLVNPSSGKSVLMATLRYGKRGRDGMVAVVNPNKSFYKDMGPNFKKYTVEDIFPSNFNEDVDEIRMALGG